MSGKITWTRTVGLPFNAEVTTNQARTGAMMAMASMLCVKVGLAIAVTLIDRIGVEGAAWATTVARAWMAGFLLVAIWREHRRRLDRQPHVPWSLDVARIKRLVGLGFPAASQVTLEVGVFAAATSLAGKRSLYRSACHRLAPFASVTPSAHATRAEPSSPAGRRWPPAA